MPKDRSEACSRCDARRSKHGKRQGADLHPVRRHGALPRPRSCAAGGHAVWRVATGASADPYALACRFSPKSNNKTVTQGRRGARADLYRCAVRRAEPAGLQRRRELRSALGDHPPDPACRPRGSHRPARGGDSLLLVPARRWRGAAHPAAFAHPAALAENAEVVGTDEAFFEDDRRRRDPRPLHRASRVRWTTQDDEVDLASYAWQVWKQATKNDAELARAVKSLPPVVYSAKAPLCWTKRAFPLLGDGRAPRRRAGLCEVARGQRPPRLGRRRTARRSPNRSSRCCARPSASPTRPRYARSGKPPRTGRDGPATRGYATTRRWAAVWAGPAVRAVARTSGCRRYAEPSRCNTLFRDAELERALDEL